MRKPLGKITIKKECRETHGIGGAFDEACKRLKAGYLVWAEDSERLKDRTWELELYLKKEE